MSRALISLIVCVVVLTAPDAFAQGSPVAEALFEEGRAAMKAEDYATACNKFAESNRIDPQPGTELNLATCSEKLGKIATAWALYKGVRAALEVGDDRRPIAEARIEALQDQVPRITINLAQGAPADSVVKIGEIEVRGAGFGSPLAIDPGDIVLVVSAPGRESVELREAIEIGSRKTIEVTPGPALPEPEPTVVPTPDPPPPPDTGSNGQAVAGWVIFGVGVAAILAGVGTGIGGLVRKSDGDAECNAQLQRCTADGVSANDEARALLTTTTVLWIAGAVIGGVGLTVALTAGPDEAALTVRPGGVDFAFRF